MKPMAHSIALRLFKVATRKAMVIFTVATLAVIAAGTGVWGHSVYATKVRAERAAQKQAATLNEVMAKLNRIESEMQQQNRVLNAKLEAVEHQNAKLAVYEVRAHSNAARLELAAYRRPNDAQSSSLIGQTSTSSSDYWEKKTCFHVALDAAIKASLELGGKGDAQGNVGVDALGDGVVAKLFGRAEGKTGFDIGPTGNVEMEFCHTWDQSSSSSGASATAMDFPALGTSAAPIPVGMQAKITQVFSEFPEFEPASVENSIDALTNINLDVSPKRVLQIAEDPSAALSDVQTLAGSLPMPHFLRNLTQDTSQIMPAFTDLQPKNFCANFSSTGGPLSKICSFIPPGLNNLQTIANVGKDVQNVQGALVNFQMDLNNFKASLGNVQAGFSHLCNSVGGAVNGLRTTSISVPQLFTFPLPTGVGVTSYTTINFPFGIPSIQIPATYGLITHTASIGPATLPPPFGFLQPVSCPSF